MAGIYIHIPFCRKACHYCNFHFSTTADNLEEMVDAIMEEAYMRRDYLQGPVATIYFGGGTPSLLPTALIQKMLSRLQELFIVAHDAEITLEANPDDIDELSLQQWKETGINRLSIGVQSFREADLQWMNRAHDAQQAAGALQLAIRHFDNITIDLIYGTPTLDDAQWLHNLSEAGRIGIPHLSCYALTVEPKTALDLMIRQQKKENVDSEKQARHFEMLMQWARQHGYEHYEISNFAKPGYRSRHNSNYWQGASYLGLGPSAHSFNGSERSWNISNNALYLKSIINGSLPQESEVLTPVDQLNEYIMTSLRTTDGLSLKTVEERWGAEAASNIKKDAAIFLVEGTMTASVDSLVLTDAGKLLADGIAARLFRG